MSLSPISQKAHDISFATFRVAALIKNSKLRGEIESSAVELVSHYEELADPSLPFTTPNVVDKLERLISLAESIGEMKAVNASVLKRELGNLQTAVDFHINTFKGHPNGTNEIDISSMFPSSTLTSGKPKNSKFSSSGNKPQPESEATNYELPTTNSQEPTVRQMAILRNIRETEFCRLRNIVEAMPNISERTIRNDIQGLIEKGLVRRVGGGGPNSYFQTMELALSDRSNSFAA